MQFNNFKINMNQIHIHEERAIL
ncbi:protein of unknown function [Candidatus Nitrosacidococcus tergens]|uniref:Uncharacterized protein n=1 Tax=Candidatus Nitrosacidococcus tergens TaxID=553981 RepID=A0A7G1Q9I6_9GAMM|nr:protein of unknown function [Candidatus Nitrosacidococcus tergens]